MCPSWLGIPVQLIRSKRRVWQRKCNLAHARNIPMRRAQLTIAALAVSTLLAACAARQNARATSTPTVPPEPGAYIDLQPGSSLIVVTPLQRSSIDSHIEHHPLGGTGFHRLRAQSLRSREPSKRRRSRAIYLCETLQRRQTRGNAVRDQAVRLAPKRPACSSRLPRPGQQSRP
jgi:hypothetical protein